MEKKLAINSPCNENWEKMQGGDAVRHCKKCRFNVYNFSAMTQEEIDGLLNNNERVCARLYIRSDGTYMTKDCKTKVRRNSFLKLFGLVALIPLSMSLFNSEGYNRLIEKARNIPVLGKFINATRPMQVMGEVCPPPTTLPVPPVKPSNEGNEETEEN